MSNLPSLAPHCRLAPENMLGVILLLDRQEPGVVGPVEGLLPVQLVEVSLV